MSEFKGAIIAYNANYANDNPMKLGRGNACAVSNNEYEAVKFE